MSAAASIEMPPWARVRPKRAAHIARVVALIEEWAEAMAVSAVERGAWRDAARWHDALRDAPEEELRVLTKGLDWPVKLLHGPAAAERLAQAGEMRSDVLEAVRWHTTGNAEWSRTGRALYMADFLEPGRSFAAGERAVLAHGVPTAFDETFREVVRLRIDRALRDGKPIFPETAELWNAIC